MAYSIKNTKEVIQLCADTAILSKATLTSLDSNSGDGDLGISIEKGALALKKIVDEYTGDDIGEFLLKCAMSFNKAAPSTMGTLISAAIMALGVDFKGKKEIDIQDIINIPASMAAAIMKRGKAQIGDKTILDSLIPFSEEFKNSYNNKKELRSAVIDAAHAAKISAEGTKGMIAKIGRAKWIAERSQDYPDGGAMLCSIIAEALAGLK